MFKEFDLDWKNWIHTNLSKGCSYRQIEAILQENGFNPDAITWELQQALEVPSPTSSEGYYQALDRLNISSAQRIKTDKAVVFTLDEFLSVQECEQLIALIEANCRPSTITNAAEVDKKFRTSQTCDLSLQHDTLTMEVDRRIADFLNLDLTHSEGLQGQYYEVGNQFKLHTDYFQPGSNEYKVHASERGQRTWTWMVYLNEVKAGGNTTFPHLDLSVMPKPGLALFWDNLKPNGAVNSLTAHAAEPVREGAKFVLTKWFRV